MRQIVRLALPVLLTACSTVLGIDGDYADAPGTDAGSGAAGAGGKGGSAGASGAGSSSGAGGAGGAGASGGVGGTSASGGTGPTGGTGAGGGTGGTSGSGGGGTGEICGNGIDDDGDQLADCADPECAASTCAPPVPSGWTGPAVMWTGNPTDTPPACPGGTTPVLTYSLDAPDADCTGVICSCQVSGTCTASATVTHYGNPNCTTGKVVSSMVLNNTSCMPYSMSEPASGGVKVAYSTNNAQTCTPTMTGTENVPPAALTQRLALCSDPMGPGGCTTGSCVTPTTTHPTVCIYRSGGLPCPGTYPYRTDAGLNLVSDSRGCSPCKCSAPFCSPSVKDHPNTTCGASSSVFTSCGATLDPLTMNRSLKLSISPGSCGASGGGPTGSVTVSSAMTICCM